MHSDPIEIALREVTDTRRLLAILITSSESFDYLQAKAALEELRVKVKVLARIQAELVAERGVTPERIIPFPVPTGPALGGGESG
jgi:hypothetical protein